MKLQYLLFEACDDGEGNGTWEAMASVREIELPVVLAEVQAVLLWAKAHAPGEQGPLDDGGVWDADQQMQVDGPWRVVTLSLTGPWDWGEALVAHFAIEP